MNLGDLFRSAIGATPSPSQQAPVQSVQQQKAAPTGQLPNGQQSTLASPQAQAGLQDASALQSGTIQQQGAASSPEGSTATPLAEFANLFKDDPKKSPEIFQLLNADPAKINEVATKINFTTGVSPDLVKKALAGDAGAFLQVVNGVAQQAFATSAQASSALVDKQASSAVEFMKKSLPDQFRKLSVSNDLQAENPQFSNPAVQPLLSLIQERLASQFPEASPAELKQHAKKYISGIVGVFAPDAVLSSSSSAQAEPGDENAMFLQQMQKNQREANNFDWDSYAIGQQQVKSS